MSATQRERFFYHSFPRRGSNTGVEMDKGCKILSLICDAGLLLAPKVVKWEYSHADGSPPRKQEYIQRRVCFTELSPSDLIEHAQNFGLFALEFEIDVLKGMGALPVFYIPRATSADASEINSLGSVPVMQTIDAMVLAMRLAGVKQNLGGTPEVVEGRFDNTFGFDKLKTFSLDVQETRKALEAFCYGLTPPDILQHGIVGLLGCFYPADNLRDNNALAYYQQREWRISGNFAVRGEEVMRRASDEVIGRLLDIDAEFFGRDFPTPWAKRLAEEALVYPGFGGKRVIQMVRRVIVPREALDRASATVARLAPDVPVVCIEELKAD
jgi:hypothetical protein